MTDHYLYPDGSQVLINLLDIRDRDTLQRVEYHLAALNAPDALAYADRTKSINSTTWRGIHRRLFGDLYIWAGKFRVVDLAKGQTVFAPPGVLRTWADREILPLFAKAATAASGREDVIKALSSCWGELNFLHPFREGNGRATQILVTALARRHGHSIDWRLIDYLTEIRAAKAAQRKDYGGYVAILGEALIEGNRGDAMPAYRPDR